MKVIFELADNLLDEDELSHLSFFSEYMKPMVKNEVKRQLVDAYIAKGIDFGELEITKEEVKAAVIDKMAERALENN